MAEALEGYRQLPEGDHISAINQLKLRLRKRSKKQRVLIWRVAASIALLVTSGVIIWSVYSLPANDLANEAPPPFEEIAQPSKSTANLDTIFAEMIEKSPPKFPTQEKNATSLAENISKEEKNKRIITQKSDETSPLISNTDASDQPAETISPEDELTLSEGGSETDYEKPIQLEETKVRDTQEEVSTIHQEDQVLNTVNGRITDRSGQPVRGAEVFSPAIIKPVQTDDEGRFKLNLVNGNRDLTIVAPGFQTEAITIGNADTLDIIINANTGQMTGSMSKKHQGKAKLRGYRYPGTQTQIVQPVGGFASFEQYISNNLTYPKAAQEANIEGEVTVRFTIKKNGKLSDLQITESLGYGCDEEALRLLKSGPRWSFPEDRDIWVTNYTIEFNLNDR